MIIESSIKLFFFVPKLRTVRIRFFAEIADVRHVGLRDLSLDRLGWHYWCSPKTTASASSAGGWCCRHLLFEPSEHTGDAESPSFSSDSGSGSKDEMNSGKFDGQRNTSYHRWCLIEDDTGPSSKLRPSDGDDFFWMVFV